MSDKTKPEGTEEAVSEAPSTPAGWQERVGAFADKVGKPLDEVTKALKDLVGEPGDDALECLADGENCPDSDLMEALGELNIPKAKLRKNLAVLRGPRPETPVVETNTVSAHRAAMAILPDLPDTESFLAALRTGGVCKIDRTVVYSAVKTGLAARFGLYDLPKLLLDAIEQHAESLDEPCGDIFYTVEKLVHQRVYADVLGGVSGRVVSEKRKNQLIQRLDTHLWQALYGFHQEVKNWQEMWQAGSANPGMLVHMFLAQHTPGMQLPPGMMAPPETVQLQDAALSVNDMINKAFSGAGVPVAKAMAVEAQKVVDLLNTEGLPGAIGAPNREQMLKMLKTAVTADYERLERNLAKYALAVMEFPKVSAESEYVYLSAMIQLGLAIPWDKVFSGANTRPTRGRKTQDALGHEPY
ncbi:hypothetical protein KJ885_05410 [Patescibacteria group bacterium]|nr:hypothetical protein [Patescibacteria group bacterium]